MKECVLSEKGKTLKDIRIFIASSKELEKERNYLAYLVLAHPVYCCYHCRNG